MFDIDRPGSVFADVSPPPDVAASPAEPRRVPMERVEAQICELAGHLAAATCRFLAGQGGLVAPAGASDCAQAWTRAVARAGDATAR